jgi:hypothetical protein
MLVQESNSNTHYASKDLFGLVQPSEKNDATTNFCIFSNMFDRVPRDALERYSNDSRDAVGADAYIECPPQLLRLLYGVTRAVRSCKQRMFKEETLAVEWQRRAHDLRVQYLMQKISEKVWEQRVYFYYTQYHAHMLHAGIVNIYLSITDGFQSEVRECIQTNADPFTPKPLMR